MELKKDDSAFSKLQKSHYSFHCSIIHIIDFLMLKYLIDQKV